MSKIKKVRIPEELTQIRSSQQSHGITCNPMDDDFSQLVAVIPGPKGTPYELGNFKVGISVGNQYPFQPPTFKFLTPIFHPNIDSSGNICLDLLRSPPSGSYTPVFTLEVILISIQLLLSYPNVDHPLRADAADMFKSNYVDFEKRAKDCVKKHCLQNKDDKPETDESVDIKEGKEPSI